MIHPFFFFRFTVYLPLHAEKLLERERERRKEATMNGDVYVRDAAKQRCSCPRCASRVLSLSFFLSLSLYVLSFPSPPLSFSSPTLYTLKFSTPNAQRKYRTNSDSIIVILEKKPSESVSVSDTVFRDDSIISQLKLQHVRGTTQSQSVSELDCRWKQAWSENR